MADRKTSGIRVHPPAMPATGILWDCEPVHPGRPTVLRARMPKRAPAPLAPLQAPIHRDSLRRGSALRITFKSCSSPKTYRRLKPGRHTFKVIAVDQTGNPDLTPAVKRFRIRR